ncbi:hypothetical protein ACFL1Q_00870 [Patescibacteria group bacterium]
MPDGMSPEKPQPQRSSVEGFIKAGPSEEQMKNWQGPGKKAELPDLRGQVPGKNVDNEALNRLVERFQSELAGARRDETGSAFIQLTDFLEKEKLPDPEALKKLYREHTVDTMATLVHDLNETRLRVVPEQYGLMRHGGNLAYMTSRLESSMSGYDNFSEMGKVENLGKVLNRDMVRFKAIEVMAEHASVFQQFYYDGMYIYAALVTGRRIKVLATDDFRLMFGKLKGLDVREDSSMPEEIGEGSGELLKKMMAEHVHFDMAIAELNRFNPEKDAGEETDMKISEVERDFLGTIFKKESGKNKTERITVNGKTFDTPLLSFYTTAETESDRKDYETRMRSLLINDAHNTLSGLSGSIDSLTVEQDRLYKDLIFRVNETAVTLKGGWDGLVSDPRTRLARWVSDISFCFNVATLNINQLAYNFEWEKGDDGNWDFKPSIAGPNTGFDAVNIWLHLQHEVEYMLKARVRTPLLAPVAQDRAWELIKKVVVEKDDPSIKKTILNNRGLSLGAAILGLYGNETKISPSDQENIENVRAGMTFNEKALKILEKTIFGFPVWVDGKVLPMPIRPMFSGINLLNTMVVDKGEGKTVLGALKEGKLLSDEAINFEDFEPYAADKWQVDLKMLSDIMKYIYGQPDKDTFALFQGNPAEAIGTLIKKLDIGSRTEKLWLDIEEENEKGEAVTVKTEVPQQFYEIVYTAYMIVAHLAFVEHGIWDGNGRWTGPKDTFWNGIPGKKQGVADWIKAAYATLPETKRGFDHYRDSMVLMICTLAQWVGSIAPDAEKMSTKTDEKVKKPYGGIVDGLKNLRMT